MNSQSKRKSAHRDEPSTNSTAQSYQRRNSHDEEPTTAKSQANSCRQYYKLRLLSRQGITGQTQSDYNRRSITPQSNSRRRENTTAQSHADSCRRREGTTAQSQSDSRRQQEDITRQSQLDCRHDQDLESGSEVPCLPRGPEEEELGQRERRVRTVSYQLYI